MSCHDKEIASGYKEVASGHVDKNAPGTRVNLFDVTLLVFLFHSIVPCSTDLKFVS